MPIGKEVVIVEYNPHWPEMFLAERSLIETVFANIPVAIEHIGSTAVPGLAAKPIIDIVLGADSLEIIEARIPALENIGYEYIHEAELIVPERRFFVRDGRYHLHCVVFQGKIWNYQLRFRDILRNNPKLARKYEELKRDLARRYPNARPIYTERKSPFVEEVLEKHPQVET